MPLRVAQACCCFSTEQPTRAPSCAKTAVRFHAARPALWRWPFHVKKAFCSVISVGLPVRFRTSVQRAGARDYSPWDKGQNALKRKSDAGFLLHGSCGSTGRACAGRRWPRAYGHVFDGENGMCSSALKYY